MRRKNKSTRPLAKALSAFFVAFLIVFGLTFTKGVSAESISDKAPASGVYDPHGYLSQDVVKKVEELNEKYRKMEKKPQIAVAIIDSLDGNLEEVANKTIRSWKVGYKETNMGLLVLVAVKDKKIRTETSNELATVLTDSDTSKLNDLVKPYFRKSDYSGGMDAYLDGLDAKFATAFSGESGKENGKCDDLKSLISELTGSSSGEENSDKATKKLRKLVEIMFGAVSFIFFVFVIPTTLIGFILRRIRYSSYGYYDSSSSHSSSSYYYKNDDEDDDKYIKKDNQTSQKKSKKKSHDDSDDDSDSGGGVFFGGSSWDSGSSFDSGSSWSSGGGFDSGSSWDGGGFDSGGSSGDW